MWSGRMSVSKLSIQAIQSGLRHIYSEKPGFAWWIPSARLPPNFPSAYSERHFCQEKNNERCKLAWPPCNEADPSPSTNFETPPTGPLRGQNAPQPRIFDLLVFVEYFHRCWSLKPSDKYFSITPFSPNIIVNLMHTLCSGQQSDLVQMQSDRCFKHNQAQISH